MIRGIAILLVCQLVGEVAARGTGFPVPGPVIGLLLLVGLLMGAERLGRLDKDSLGETDIGRVSEGLLSNMSMLFVPAGVGVVQYLGLVGTYGGPLALALVGSTFVTLLATVGIFVLVKRLIRGDAGETSP